MWRLAIIGTLIVVLLVGGLMLTGFMYFMGRIVGTKPASDEAIHTAQTTVINFFEDLNSGGAEKAYANTSSGFKSRQTLEQFQKWVDHYPQVKEAGEKALQVRPKSTTHEIKFDLSVGEKGRSTIKLTLTVIFEGGDWKVDAVQVQ